MAQRRIGRRAVVRTAGGAFAAAAVLAGGASAAAQDEGNGLVGTWVVTSTRAGSVPNGILVHVFPDGGFLRTGNAHPTESPAFGVWQPAGDGVYDVTYVALQFDKGGAYTGRRKSWLRITPDPSGDTFTGQFRIVTSDVNGAESAPTEGDITGARMAAETFA